MKAFLETPTWRGTMGCYESAIIQLKDLFRSE